MDFVLNFFVRLVDLIAFELFEIVVFVAVGVIFLFFLILKVTSHKINGKINALYFTSTMFVLFLYRFAIETNGKQSSNWLLLTAFIFLFALPINCFSKKEKNNENGKEFVKFIDKKIAEQEQRVTLTTNPIEQKVLELQLLKKELSDEEAEKFENFIDKLEVNDDVQNVWHNADI